MASIGSQGVASSAISSFSGSFPLGTSSARQGLFSLQEGSAYSPVIVSVSMAPQVRDSQVLEWTGRLMPWKGEASRPFSTSLNIVSEDVLPTLHCWAMQGRSIFSCVLSGWLLVHFKRREQENVTAKIHYTHMHINHCISFECQSIEISMRAELPP